MLIAVDARFYGKAGPGRYIKNLLYELEKIDSEHTYLVFLTKEGMGQYQPKNPKFKKLLADLSWYSFEEQLLFPIILFLHNPDLLYVPHFNIPVFYPGKLVSAIPDLIMSTFSTEGATTLPKLYYRFKKLIYRFVLLVAVIRSYKIIVPSLATKSDFLKAFKFSKEAKYVLAYEGVDRELESAQQLNDDKSYFLYIGSMYDHKNLKRLIDAYQIFAKSGGTQKLVIIGKRDFYSKKTVEYVGDLQLQDKILFPGEQAYVSDKELADYKARALAYVFPSLKEGFSLTPLEAMDSGLPCVISKIPCHEEIYGDSVLYFDPENVQEMATKLETISKDGGLRENLRNKGLELVKKYSWEETAKKTLEVFNAALHDS